MTGDIYTCLLTLYIKSRTGKLDRENSTKSDISLHLLYPVHYSLYTLVKLSKI